MLQTPPFQPRTECPPGLCVCNREELLSDPQGDMRILMLTREAEKKLVERLDRVDSYQDLLKVIDQMHDKLGIVLTIRPSVHEVRTVRGIQIVLSEQPGLCRKTRQAVPAAIRRCLEARPEIAYAILNAHDLFGS